MSARAEIARDHVARTPRPRAGLQLAVVTILLLRLVKAELLL